MSQVQEALARASRFEAAYLVFVRGGRRSDVTSRAARQAEKRYSESLDQLAVKFEVCESDEERAAVSAAFERAAVVMRASLEALR